MATHREAAAAHEAASTYYKNSQKVDQEARRLTSEAVDTSILVWSTDQGPATEADTWAAMCAEALAEGADCWLMADTHTLAAQAHSLLMSAN